MTKGPYIAERSGTVWWNVYDTRTGNFVSYPTNKKNCMAEVETMNRAYAEAVAEMNIGDVTYLVVSAEHELETTEYSGVNTPYRELCALANTTDTQGRTLIAKMILLTDARELRLSRAFDNCFENGDGAQVRAALEADLSVQPYLQGVFS